MPSPTPDTAAHARLNVPLLTFTLGTVLGSLIGFIFGLVMCHG